MLAAETVSAIIAYKEHLSDLAFSAEDAGWEDWQNLWNRRGFWGVLFGFHGPLRVTTEWKMPIGLVTLAQLTVWARSAAKCDRSL